MLQKLAETTLTLCAAETAVVSLLETDADTERFRWEAVAGVFANHRHHTLPRDGCPSGVCIDEDEPQLMYLPDRLYPALRLTPRVVETLLVPIHFCGRPIGTVWIASHSEGRKFDREDQRLMQGLAHFASAAWQLWKGAEKIDLVNNSLDNFLALLGHELRNPLMAIAGASRMVRQERVENPVIQSANDLIIRQTQHLTTLVQDLFDVTRVHTGKLELHKYNVELMPLVHRAIETVSPQIENHHHQLTVNNPTIPVFLNADPLRLTQIFSNLLDNAAKYTPDGGHVSLTVESLPDEVLIRVRDNGNGMPPEKLNDVFGLFTQLGSSDDIRHEGLGLGLRLVRTLTEAHGGTVNAVSDGIGKGSEFLVRLPVRVATAADHVTMHGRL
jgi:signal transduction histidine kinase